MSTRQKLLIQITLNKKVEHTGSDAPTLLGFLQLNPSEFKYNFQQKVMQKLLKYNVKSTTLNQHKSGELYQNYVGIASRM
jgi:hypothetical protein